MKVYVLVNTYWDDTRNEGVTSDKAKAEEWAESRGNSYEEFELDGETGFAAAMAVVARRNEKRRKRDQAEGK